MKVTGKRVYLERTDTLVKATGVQILLGEISAQ